ncbi:MAG TPA: prolyl oligopeptidase [Verrucomicrobiales bacterium]|nr:prolyl oligopeptidase [Verrucomicrobiales bacterium]HRJ08307.1 prolyl oligopeptidase family serine peptidase [Prosthecobacter sp.]HRK14922.1 prolyl oligopeptidase family serine peptidase [Prosthecobacter sp.]
MFPRVFILSLLMLPTSAFTQLPSAWPDGVGEILVKSTADGTEQPALAWSPRTAEARPLLVGLHTWGGDYKQTSNGPVFARWCMERGWHFVFPHFRGPNRTPEAMGGNLAVQDIADAVAWMKKTRRVDEARVYLIGASGGGHMAMLMAGRHPEIWAGVSAWVGISDIAAWHAEHLKDGMPDNYAKNIESALGGPPDSEQRLADARRRSPLTWLHQARGVNLDISHGIHDGRSGSVAFRHSLHAFNAVVPEADRLPLAEIAAYYETMQRPANWPAPEPDPVFEPKSVLFRKTSGNTRVTLFEGGHEILKTPGLNWLAAQQRGKPAVWEIKEVFKIQGGTEAGR